MIASSIETNAANVRKIMSQLKKSGLIFTKTGKPQPSLAKSPDQISLLDVYRSIEGNTQLIQVDPKTNPNCVVGANIQEALEESYARLQKKAEEEMAKITLDSLIHKIAVLERKKTRKHRPRREIFIILLCLHFSDRNRLHKFFYSPGQKPCHAPFSSLMLRSKR